MWKYTPYPTYLQHYASEYYDPEKAHQYYEEHKKLKGRSSSTAKLSEKGKAAAAYVKNQINEEKTAKLRAETERHAEETKQRSEQKQKTVEQHSKAMNQRINSLKAALKRMPEAQRQEQAPKIKAIIYKLREENKKKRIEIETNHRKAQYESSVKSMETKEAIRDEATSKYETELEKIRQST